jgi:polar amino acid transport system substrate-binding protein
MLGRYPVAVSLLLVLTLVAGCSRDAGPVAADEFQPVTPGVLTIVTDLPAPGFWLVEGDAFVGGFEYALARSFADDLGLDLEVRDVEFTDIVAGRVDDYDLALAEVTVTDRRDQAVDFTEPYLEVDDGILTRSGLEVPDLATARDLEWGVVAGTTQEVLVNESVLPRRPATTYPNLETALEALESGGIEALLLDTPIALAEEARSAGELEVPAQFDTGQNFAGVLPSGSPNRDVIDALIRRARSNGSLDEMRIEWLDPLLGRDPSTVPYLPLRTPRS